MQRRKMEDEERKAKDETKERTRTLEKARSMREKRYIVEIEGPVMAECANLPRIRNNGGLNTDTAELEEMLVMTCMRRSTSFFHAVRQGRKA